LPQDNGFARSNSVQKSKGFSVLFSENNKKGSASFLKKRTKKLLIVLAAAFPDAAAPDS
jgi:hypothetical protein